MPASTAPSSKPVGFVAMTALPALVQRFHALFNPSGIAFTPGDPIAPVAPEPMPRQTQIQVGANVTLTPRSGDSAGVLLPFDQLRYFARNYDVAAIAIQRRIKQIQGLQWDVTLRDPDDAGAKPDRARVKRAKAFLDRPDGVHDWQSWVGAVLRDRLEIDAVTLYPRMTVGGDLYGMEYIDGATIKPLIDPRGRQPEPPAPCYQQILWGRPTSMFTRDQLIYAPANLMTDSAYGRSEIENVIISVNIALRKQHQDLAHFTDGNVPRGLLGVPGDWTAQDIATYQTFFDNFLAGNAQARSRLVMAPAGNRGQPGVHEFAEFTGDPAFDMFLFRKTLAALDMTADELGYTEDSNRSVGDSQQNVVNRGAIKPLANYLISIVNCIFARYLGLPELGLVCTTLEAEDALAQAQVHDLQIRNGTKDSDEVRRELGANPRGKPFILVPAAAMTMVADIGKIPLGMELGPDGQPRPPVDPNDPTDSRIPRTRENDALSADDDGNPPKGSDAPSPATQGTGAAAEAAPSDVAKAIEGGEDAMAKQSQADAHYVEPAPDDRGICEDCAHFRWVMDDGAYTCAIVAGPISVLGTCDHFVPSGAKASIEKAMTSAAYAADGAILSRLARDEVRARRTTVLKALREQRAVKPFVYRSVPDDVVQDLEDGIDQLVGVPGPERETYVKVLCERALASLTAEAVA